NRISTSLDARNPRIAHLTMSTKRPSLLDKGSGANSHQNERGSVGNTRQRCLRSLKCFSLCRARSDRVGHRSIHERSEHRGGVTLCRAAEAVRRELGGELALFAMECHVVE